MTEDPARHPAAGGRGPLALCLGLGALFAAGAWVVASFFLGAASASAAEPPVAVPPGLVSSASDSAGALSADLDRVASTALAAVGLPGHAASVAPVAPAAPTRRAAWTPPPAPASRTASPAPAVPTGPVVSVVQQVTHSLSAASPALSAPIVAPVDAVTDAASGLVSAATDTTDALLPVPSRDVVGPIAKTVQQVLDTAADAPVADLPAGAAGAAPTPPASAEVVGAPGGSVPGAPGDEPHAAGPTPSSARQLPTGAYRGAAAGVALVEASTTPGSLPEPSLPLPTPNAGAATAGTDTAGGGSAGGPGVAEFVRPRFSPATLVTTSGHLTGIIRPLSPSYDSDSTPD